MLTILFVLACPPKPKDDGDTGYTPPPNPCEGVEGSNNTRHTEYRYGDVTLAPCRDLMFGGPPVLASYKSNMVPGSVVVGTRTGWREGDELSSRAIVHQIELHPEGDEVRILEFEPGVWTEVSELEDWAATSGSVVDVDGDGLDDVLVTNGDMFAALSAFMDSPSASPDVQLIPFRVYDLGDVTGDGVADIARFVEVLADPKEPDSVVSLLSVLALPVGGALEDQPWDLMLGDNTYVGGDSIVRLPEDGLVSGGFDHNGDGIGDVVFGEELRTAQGPGTVRVYNGPVVETRVEDEADSTLRRDPATCNEYPDYRLCDSVGGYLRSGGDLDRDGYDDLIIGSSWTSYAGVGSSGAVWVVPGPLDGTLDIDIAASAMITATETYTKLPGDVYSGGDLDADGWLDLIVTRNTGSKEPAERGVRLLFGPFEGSRDWTDGPQLFADIWPYTNSLAMNEDLDGDGIHDLVMIVNFPPSLHIWYSTISMEWPRSHTLE